MDRNTYQKEQANNMPYARARGCILGVMIGDALGAGVEGWSREAIRELAQSRWKCDMVQEYFLAVHMGTYVPGDQPAQYRRATIDDPGYCLVPTGPPSNAAVAEKCARFGMYTDDTNTSLALASSLVECGCIDSTHVARRTAEFGLIVDDDDHFRGYPATATNVMQAALDGVSVDITGLPPLFPFPGGSFANGGAMRIAPLALAMGPSCASSDSDVAHLRSSVAACIRGSHRHPEAIDFATVQAAAIRYASASSPDSFKLHSFFRSMIAHCATDALREVVSATAERNGHALEGLADDLAGLSEVVGRVPRPGSGLGFQIASVHMCPCVLWVVARHYSCPASAVQKAIDLGGDTDTTASMVGAIVGALHGESSWPESWKNDLENGARGRDYALELAEQLTRVDLFR